MAFTLNPTWDTIIYAADPGPEVAWVDVDLSAIIGAAGRYLVFLIAEHWDAGSGGQCVCLRPKDLAYDFKNAAMDAGGIGCGSIHYIGDQLIIAQITDDASVVQVRETSSGGRGLRLYCLGWAPWTVVTGEVFPLGIFPTPWADLDISATLGRPGKNLVCFIAKRGDVLQTPYGIKRKGDPTNIWDNSDFANPSILWDYAATCASILMSTNANQIVEHMRGASANLTGSVELFGYSPHWTSVEQTVFGPALFPGVSGAWVDLDLSGIVGKRRVIVFLRITRAGAYANTHITNFRPKDVTVAFRNAVPGSGAAQGCCSCMNEGSGAGPVYMAFVFGITDANGVLAWSSNSTVVNHTIFLDGYLDDPLPAGAVRTSPLTRDAVAQLDLAQGAGTYTALTAVGDVIIEGMSFNVTTAGAALTSLSVQTDQTNSTVFLTAAEGAVAALVVQKNLAFAFSGFPVRLASGQKLTYTVVGAGTGVVQACVLHRAAVQGSGARLV